MLYFSLEPVDYMSVETLVEFAAVRREMLGGIRRVQNAANITGVFYSTNALLRSDFVMNARSKANGKRNGSNSGSGVRSTSSPASGGITWCNVYLTDEDALALDQLDLKLEDLIPRLFNLCVRGFNVSIKPLDSGKSFSCSIYRPAGDDNGSGRGLSGFGETVGDAVISALYKFEYKLEGEFPSDDGANKVVHKRFR